MLGLSVYHISPNPEFPLLPAPDSDLDQVPYLDLYNRPPIHVPPSTPATEHAGTNLGVTWGTLDTPVPCSQPLGGGGVNAAKQYRSMPG